MLPELALPERGLWGLWGLREQAQLAVLAREQVAGPVAVVR